MFFISQPQALQTVFLRNLLPPLRLVNVLLLGAGTLLLCLPNRARAAELVTLKYNNTEATVRLSDINRFAETGQLPEQLQQFFDTTQQVPDRISSLLQEHIQVPQFVIEFLATPRGEFVLYELNKVVQGRTGLTALRNAVSLSLEDEQISVLELLKNYPEREITVDVKQLEPIYNDVTAFVDRVLPAVEIAKEFLQDLTCDCQTPAANSTSSSESGSSNKTVHAGTALPVTTRPNASVTPDGTSSRLQAPSATQSTPRTTP
jgi:hypothetical protein